MTRTAIEPRSLWLHSPPANTGRMQWLSRDGELGQLADVMHVHFADVLTQLAPSGEEPVNQLPASDVDGARDGFAVDEDRVALPL